VSDNVTLSASYPLPDANNQLPSLAYLKSVIENVVIDGLDRSNLDETTSSLATISSTAPASPSAGEIWVDASGTPYVIKFYDGAAWAAQMAVGDTAPSTTTVGLMWYDTTLKVYRVYETRNSITGWHAVSGGYELMQNTGSTNIVAGDVVCREFAQAVPVGVEESTLVAKRRDVAGVAAEDFATSANGLVATVGSGLTVKCQVDNTTYGLVAGDMLVTDAFTRGVGRSVGQYEPSIFEAIGQRSTGNPHGSFAICESTPGFSGNGTHDVVLMDEVGRGRMVSFNDKLIANLGDVTADNVTLDAAEFGTTNWNEFDLKVSPATAGSLLLSEKHEPLAGFVANMYMDATGTVFDGDFNFGDTTTSAQKTVGMNLAINRGAQVTDFFVSTTATKFYMQMPGSSNVAVWELDLVGYTY